MTLFSCSPWVLILFLFYLHLTKTVQTSFYKLTIELSRNQPKFNFLNFHKFSQSNDVILVFNKYFNEFIYLFVSSPTGDADSHEGAFQSLVPVGAVLYQHIDGRDTLSSGVCGIVSDGELLVDRTAHRNKSYNILHGGQYSCQLDGASMGFLHRCYYAN